MPAAALALAFAALMGLLLGLLGGGGSILTVPVLVYVAGYEAKQAVAMSLAVVAIVSSVGAVGHWRAGRVRVKTALGFAAVAMVGAFGGARLAELVSGAVQLVLLAAIMLIAAVLMLTRGASERAEGHPPRDHAVPTVAGAGLGVGVLTGLVGIGGGFLIVPALVILVGLPMKEAVGTSLLVITLNAAAGFAGYLGQVQVPWDFLAGFAAVAIGGIVAGTRLVQHVPTASLRRGFAVFLIVVGVFVLYQNRAVL